MSKFIEFLTKSSQDDDKKRKERTEDRKSEISEDYFDNDNHLNKIFVLNQKYVGSLDFLPSANTKIASSKTQSNIKDLTIGSENDNKLVQSLVILLKIFFIPFKGQLLF